MEIAVKERIREMLLRKESNPTKLAKEYSVNQKTLNNQINSSIQLSVSTILLILNAYPDISAEWLLRGDGDMIKSSEPRHLDEHDELVKLRAENNLLRDMMGLKELQNKNVG